MYELIQKPQARGWRVNPATCSVGAFFPPEPAQDENVNSIKLSIVIGCGLLAVWPGASVYAAPTTDSTPAEAAGDVAKWNRLNRRYFEAKINSGSAVPDGVWAGKTGAFRYTETNGTIVQKSFTINASGLSEFTKPVAFDLAKGTITEGNGTATRVSRVTSEQAHVFTVETVSVSGSGSESLNTPPLKVRITPEVIEYSDLSGNLVKRWVWTSREEAVAAIQRDGQAKPAAIGGSQNPHGYFGEAGRSFAFEIEGSGDELTVRSLFGTWLYRRQFGNVFAYNEHYTLQVVDAEHVIWNPPGQEVDDDPMVYQKMDPTVAREQIRIGKAAIADVEAEMAATPYTSYEDSGSGDSSSSDSPLKATYDALVKANAEAGAHLAQTQAHYEEVMDQAREQAAYERTQAEGSGSDAAMGASSQDVANARAATERQYEIERQFNAEQARQAALRVEEVQRATTPPPATESAPVASSSSPQGPRMGFDGRDCAEAQLGAQHWVGTSGTYEIESTQTKPDGWCHIIIKNWHSSGAASFQ
jgi:hypothetical protein